MKKTLLLVCLLLALFVLVASSAPSPRRTQRKAAHSIALRGNDGATACSATAVGPNVLLTAGHCDVETADVYVDGGESAHRIAGRIFDDHDSMLLILADAPFHDYASIRAARRRPAQQGERVYWWGSPRGMTDIYRTGYLAGAVVTEEAPIVPGATVYVIAAPSTLGDSGAGIYAEDGRLLGVETYGIFDGLFTGYYSLTFTDAQLRQAGL